MKKFLFYISLALIALLTVSCGAGNGGQDKTGAHEHVFGEWSVVSEPSCTEDGSRERVCLDCGSKETEAIHAAGHVPEAIPAVEASCTETGLSEGSKCTVCGEILKVQETVAAKGHTPEPVPAKDPTCTESGLTEGSRCAVCGEILKAQESVAAKGHTPEPVPAKDPTCTESGLTEGKKCSVCGETIEAQEKIAAKGHTPGEWIIDREATLSEDGEKHQICAVCGKTIKTAVISSLAKYEPVTSSSEKVIALTFDDGPHYTNTKKLLDIIEEKGVKVTFFVQGVNMDTNGDGKTEAWAKEYMKRAIELGCEYGNHSYNHANFNKLSNDSAMNQINRTTDLIIQGSGVAPILFRAPYGNLKNKNSLVANAGYHIVFWSVDTLDWSYASDFNKGKITRDECIQKTLDVIKKQAKSGGIILMHDIHAPSIDTAALAIDWLLGEGYRLVTVSELCDLKNRDPVTTTIFTRSSLYKS